MFDSPFYLATFHFVLNAQRYPKSKFIKVVFQRLFSIFKWPCQHFTKTIWAGVDKTKMAKERRSKIKPTNEKKKPFQQKKEVTNLFCFVSLCIQFHFNSFLVFVSILSRNFCVFVCCCHCYDIKCETHSHACALFNHKHMLRVREHDRIDVRLKFQINISIFIFIVLLRRLSASYSYSNLDMVDSTFLTKHNATQWAKELKRKKERERERDGITWERSAIQNKASDDGLQTVKLLFWHLS